MLQLDGRIHFIAHPFGGDRCRRQYQDKNLAGNHLTRNDVSQGAIAQILFVIPYIGPGLAQLFHKCSTPLTVIVAVTNKYLCRLCHDEYLLSINSQEL